MCEVMQRYLAQERAAGRAEGHAAGRAEGHAAGRAEKEAEMANALRESGVPEEIIQAAILQSREKEERSN